MAKGDTASMMMRGTMGGLAPLNAIKGIQAPPANAMAEQNAAEGSAVNPSEQFMNQIGMGIGNMAKPMPKDKLNPNMGNEPQMPNSSPLFSPSVGGSLAGPRLMPMQSGSKFARGKNPIGTNPQKMMKYGSGSY